MRLVPNPWWGGCSPSVLDHNLVCALCERRRHGYALPLRIVMEVANRLAAHNNRGWRFRRVHNYHIVGRPPRSICPFAASDRDLHHITRRLATDLPAVVLAALIAEAVPIIGVDVVQAFGPGIHPQL